MEARLQQISDDSGAAALSKEAEEAASVIFAEWAVIANDKMWFDDCLNEHGVGEAAASGREVGVWLSAQGLAPELLVTSPFRRAWQTQLISFGHGFASKGVKTPIDLTCDSVWPLISRSPTGAWVRRRALAGPRRPLRDTL